MIFIILLVSVIAFASGAFSSFGHRQVSEAGRILQGALVGARDQAIHTGQPSGIRLIPDPAFDSIDSTTGLLDHSRPLAYSRIIPIGPAPEYSEGAVTVRPGASYLSAITNPDGDPKGSNVVLPSLVLEQAFADDKGAPNAPTSWAWNIRVGDRIQVHDAGPWYTVCGPVWQANPEGFVNWGPPGTVSPLNPSGSLPIEWLLLVNGRDDNGNGYADDGFDGVDNNGNGVVDEYGEWLPNQGFPLQAGQTPTPGETEAWIGALAAGATSVPYTVHRRPMPQPGAREVALPTAMVIDATTVFGTQERSRLPVDPSSGNVDILVNPDGSVSYSLPWGSPSSVGLGATFLHFWLAERQDVAIPSGTAAPMLPITKPGGSGGYAGATLRGECAILTLGTRTGSTALTRDPKFWFDPPQVGTTYSAMGFNNQGVGSYSPSNPFLPAEQGVSSGP